MYYIYGIPGPSLLIESTDSMIGKIAKVAYKCDNFCDENVTYN